MFVVEIIEPFNIEYGSTITNYVIQNETPKFSTLECDLMFKCKTRNSHGVATNV